MDVAMALEIEALAKQKPMLDAMQQTESEVQTFYKNSVVFLTGGTGFLGKQLTEKLFRSCQISKMYMLMRPKKGKDVHERIQDMTKDPVFDSLWQQKPNFIDKIVAIEGDVAETRLGIRDDNWNTLTEEVDVIFHVAATTRFDEPLRAATFINVRGTREALLLGKTCKKLRSFVHVSTAYCHATATVIECNIQEEFYDSPISPDALISMAEKMDLNRLDNITNNLIKDWPNTYTFTKAIGEELVRTTSVGLPICIVRPAIVMSTYREPSTGWLDNSCLYGVTGLIFGTALGVIHAGIGNPNATLSIVPCDYVNNAIIVAARETASNQAKGGNDTKIYTVSTTHRNPVTLGNVFFETLEVRGKSIMPPKSIYYVFIILATNKLYFMFLSLFLHIIPAYAADLICTLMGKQRRFGKLAIKLYSMQNKLIYFGSNGWNFVDNNLEKLFSDLSKQDQAIYNFDVTSIDWAEYTLVICLGLRKYIFKDGLKDTQYAIKKQKLLRIVNYFLLSLYAYCVWKLIYLIFFMGINLLVVLKNILKHYV